jgi:anti-anti-sigma factor
MTAPIGVVGGGSRVDSSSLTIDASEPVAVDPDGTPGPVSVPVLTVRGELDSANCHELVDAVEAVVGVATGPEHGAGAGRMVLDLDGVAFCDSRGLSALVGAVTSAARRGWSLRLSAGTGSALRRLLTRVAMTEVLALHREVQDAAAARGPSPLEAEVHGR